MRILTRYVLSEVGHVFLLALVSLTTLMMLVGIAKEALQQGLGLQQMAQLIPYLLPGADVCGAGHHFVRRGDRLWPHGRHQ